MEDVDVHNEVIVVAAAKRSYTTAHHVSPALHITDVRPMGGVRVI